MVGQLEHRDRYDGHRRAAKELQHSLLMCTLHSLTAAPERTEKRSGAPTSPNLWPMPDSTAATA